MKSVEWKFGDLRREVKNLENFFNNHREQVERELIQKWAFFKENIESFKAIIFPSKSFLDYFKRQIDIPEERCRLVAHGVNVNQPAKLRDYSHNRPVNLIFVAGGSPERKGWQIVKGALEKLSQTHNSRFRVRVYAQMNDRFKSESGLGNLKNIEFLPAFPPDNLSDVLQWADVGLLPTSFETYCRLIREFILSGVIPITTSAFGIEEVITNNKNGIIIERLKDDNLYQEIIRLLDSPETMATLGKNLQTTIVESPVDEFKALVKIYDSIH